MADSEPGKQTAHYMTVKTDSKEKVGFWLYLPVEYKEKKNSEFPLLVFLHGSGERGDDLDAVKVHGPPKLIDQGKEFPFVVLSPQCPEEQWWDADVVFKLIEEIAEKYSIDRHRIYITGLSMGGFGTWSLVFRHPDYFAAAVPICGGGQANLLHPSNKRLIDKLKKVPFWVFHGAGDQSVRVQESEEMVEALKRVGGSVKFTVYPDAGHDVWTQTYANDELYEWILDQRLQ